MAHTTEELVARLPDERADGTAAPGSRSGLQLPSTLTSPWAWFVVCCGFSFLFNNQLVFDSKYAELAAHAVIGACAVLAGRFLARQCAELLTRFAPRSRSTNGYANGVVVAVAVVAAGVGAAIGFEAATLYTREMLSAGANRTAALERQREWLDEKTRTNLIRPDQPYRLGLPSFLYISLPTTARH